MRHFIYKVLLFLGLTLLVDANDLIKSPFLWKAAKGPVTCYLFGTMHLADPRIQILPTVLIEAIERSDAVYTEVSLSPEEHMRSASLMLRTDGSTLQGTLPASLYERSRNYLSSIHSQLDMKVFESMKLWAFSATLQFLEARLNYPDLQAIDAIIYHYALAKGKQVGGIETVAEQLSAMDAFSEQEQLLMHEATLDYLEQNRDYTLTMVELYLNGDSEKLMRYLTSMMYQEPKYRSVEKRFLQLLLYERNKRMAERIIQKVTNDPNRVYFFAFGTMHFLDQKSIIELLEAEGFTVQRILRH